METKKTAVQELMTELQELHPSLFDVHTEKGRQFVNHFHKFLSIEKAQLLDFYAAGHLMGYEFTPSGRETLGAETYYNEQFNIQNND